MTINASAPEDNSNPAMRVAAHKPIPNTIAVMHHMTNKLQKFTSGLNG